MMIVPADTELPERFKLVVPPALVGHLTPALISEFERQIGHPVDVIVVRKIETQDE